MILVNGHILSVTRFESLNLNKFEVELRYECRFGGMQLSDTIEKKYM